MTITEAEGFADLGMWEDAWEALDDAPGHERATPSALRVRLRCCAPLGAWGIGEEVAHLMGHSDKPEDLKMAADFWLDWGRYDPELAATCITAAISVWPECRAEILDDPLLGRVLFPGRH
jgi:hypothetical protein